MLPPGQPPAQTQSKHWWWTKPIFQSTQHTRTSTGTAHRRTAAPCRAAARTPARTVQQRGSWAGGGLLVLACVLRQRDPPTLVTAHTARTQPARFSLPTSCFPSIRRGSMSNTAAPRARCRRRCLPSSQPAARPAHAAASCPRAMEVDYREQTPAGRRQRDSAFEGTQRKWRRRRRRQSAATAAGAIADFTCVSVSDSARCLEGCTERSTQVCRGFGRFQAAARRKRSLMPTLCSDQSVLEWSALLRRSLKLARAPPLGMRCGHAARVVPLHSLQWKMRLQ